MRSQPAALRTLGRWLDVNATASWRHETTRCLLCPDTGVAYVLKPDTFEPVISCCGDGYNGDSMQPGDKATGFVAFQVPKGFEVDKVRAEATFARTGPVAELEVD
jgi:hypothetical protein